MEAISPVLVMLEVFRSRNRPGMLEELYDTQSLIRR